MFLCEDDYPAFTFKQRTQVNIDMTMEKASCINARTLFGNTVESNVAVAAALILLTVLATEFVINFEVRKIRDRRKRRKDRVSLRRTHQRKSTVEDRIEDIPDILDSPIYKSTSMIDDRSHLTRSQSAERPTYIYPQRFVKNPEKIKLTLEEKELSKRLLSIYFNRLNKLIENN